MSGKTAKIIEFPNGYTATSVRSLENTNVREIVTSLNLKQPNGILVLSGGAGSMEQLIYDQMQSVFNIIANFVNYHDMMVIDGGTDAGIMSLMGKALGRNGRTADHVGILPAKASVSDDGRVAEDILEPHHSHFILIESDDWGGEVNTMYRLIKYYSIRTPIIVLLINGGEISLREIQSSVALGYKIILFAGSGRLADEIAVAIRYPDKPRRPEIADLIPKGRFLIYNLSSSTAELKKLLEEQFVFEDLR